MTRIIKAVVGFAAASALVAGCGSNGSDVTAAAVVGHTTIPLAGFQDEITKLIDEKPDAQQALQQRKLDTATRTLLTLKIRHQLLADVAAREGLHSDPAQVNQQLQQIPDLDQYLANTIFDRAAYRQNLDDETLMQDLARKQAPGLRVTMDNALVADPNTAKDLARKVAANPEQAQNILSSAGGQVGIGQALTPAQDMQLAASTPIFGIPQGTVAAFPAGGQSSQWYVVKIDKREQMPDRSATAAIAKADPKALTSLGQLLLGADATNEQVTVNPRYGTWDSLAANVVKSAGENYGVEYPLRKTKP